MSTTPPSEDRRPLAVRERGWAKRVAAWLSQRSITPNQISVCSVAFAAFGATALLLCTRWQQPVWLLLAALCVQARLLCNLFDGMVAVEGGKATPTGGLYNDVPDRIADPLLLIAAGYAAGIEWLGWLAALLAVLTAYVRTLGAALGLGHDFSGPMAKQHRMAVLTVACVLAFAEFSYRGSFWCLQLGLLVIALGSAWTCVSRLRRAARALRAGA
jgi:phosphatidylglycerophosphate synthase